jgi:DNA-binding GntR family transcriptional regulator
VSVELKGRPQTLTDLVHRWLRDAIVTGDLAAGARVTEAGVAQKLGVSKSPVRESLLRLREIGLLEDDGRRGHRIVRATRAAIDDAYLIRELVEPYAAGCAARRGSARELEAIRAAAERNREAAAREELDERVHKDADQAFHETIAAASGSGRIFRVVADAGALIRAIGPGVDARAMEALRLAGEEHVAIAQAIAAHEADAAADGMRRHLQRVRAAVLADESLADEPTS